MIEGSAISGCDAEVYELGSIPGYAGDISVEYLHSFVRQRG